MLQTLPGPAFRAIFSGRVRHERVDQFNQRTWCSKRLIKVIHCNLMLKWIRTHFPRMRIVLLLRHPCAVVHSLLHLGWDPALEHLLCQEDLMSGMLSPFRAEMERAASPFEDHLFLWCAETYVALHQVAPDDVCLVFYEQLCENPEAEIARLFAFLGLRYDQRVLAQLELPSPLSRPDSTIVTGGSLIDSWRAGITAEQLARTMEVLELFGLKGIYSEEAMPNVQAAYELVETSREFG
ncbi:MAG: sulfotransferase [Chloroflexi bacterium]|nr:sulfotransferase [Chloroflexota bacterium]